MVPLDALVLLFGGCVICLAQYGWNSYWNLDHLGIYRDPVSFDEFGAICPGATGLSMRSVFENSQVLPRREGPGEYRLLPLLSRGAFDEPLSAVLQGIMLRLREKAHASLAAYRNTPPSRAGTLSEPSTPADDNDELTTLGGRTRLVEQKEKSMSPQITDRSPTSLNPVVPLPLKQPEEQQVHPYVLQYLRTFVPSPPNGTTSLGAGPSQAGPSGMQNGVPVSPSQYQPHHTHMHNLQPISTSFAGPDAFQHQQQQQPQQQLPGLQMEGLNTMFPQYFPVFDYGHVGGGGASEMYATSPVPMDGDYGGRSYSPENTMQTVWQDFVAQVGMQ